jgi:hypothetical protein
MTSLVTLQEEEEIQAGTLALSHQVVPSATPGSSTRPSPEAKQVLAPRSWAPQPSEP